MGIITGIFLLAVMGAGGAYYYKTQIQSGKEANADAAVVDGGSGGWFGFGGGDKTDEETGDGVKKDTKDASKKKEEGGGWFSDFKMPDQNGLQMTMMKQSISNAFK